MKRIRTILRQRRGESLVEVLCAFVLFLLALGTLRGGVRFAHSSMAKAESLRSETAALKQRIEEAPIMRVDTKTYTFYLTGTDGKTTEAFRVTVGLDEKEMERENGEAVAFALFGPAGEVEP